MFEGLLTNEQMNKGAYTHGKNASVEKWLINVCYETFWTSNEIAEYASV